MDNFFSMVWDIKIWQLYFVDNLFPLKKQLKNSDSLMMIPILSQIGSRQVIERVQNATTRSKPAFWSHGNTRIRGLYASSNVLRLLRSNMVSKTHRSCFYSWQSRFERATRSVATFVRSHRSLRSLAPQRSALLHSLCSLAPFTGSLTHFAPSLVGWLKFMLLCSHCNRVTREQTR